MSLDLFQRLEIAEDAICVSTIQVPTITAQTLEAIRDNWIAITRVVRPSDVGLDFSVSTATVTSNDEKLEIVRWAITMLNY
jgi:hypothetical protein